MSTAIEHSELHRKCKVAELHETSWWKFQPQLNRDVMGVKLVNKSVKNISHNQVASYFWGAFAQMLLFLSQYRFGIAPPIFYFKSHYHGHWIIAKQWFKFQQQPFDEKLNHKALKFNNRSQSYIWIKDSAFLMHPVYDINQYRKFPCSHQYGIDPNFVPLAYLPDFLRCSLSC